MATAVTIGLGALAAGLAGRHFLRASRKGAEEWVKGGFRAKMDRREAIQILGLKYVSHFLERVTRSYRLIGMVQLSTSG